MSLETSFLLERNKALIHLFSSAKKGCSALNLLSEDKKAIWLTEKDLPQQVTFDISNLIEKPPYLSGFGVFCWQSYEINPRLIEVLISKEGSSFITMGHFELSLISGIQILSIDRISLEKISYVRFIIKETHGGMRAYINKIYLYRDIPQMTEYVPTVESRQRIPLKSQATEVMISDSDLSDKMRQMTTEQLLNTRSNYSSSKKQHETSMQMDNNINIITDYDNDNQDAPHKTEEDTDDNNQPHLKEKDNQMTPTPNNEASSHNNHQFNYLSNNASQNLRETESLNHQDKLCSFEARISNLETEVGEIKVRLDHINQNVETLVEVHNNFNQNNYNYILNECKKIVNYKIGHLLCNDSKRQSNRKHQDTYHEYAKQGKDRKPRESLSKAAIETSITSRLDQKFSNFSSQLETHIYNSVLKPAMDHLELNLQTNLTEVQNQLKSAEKMLKHQHSQHRKKQQEDKLNYLLSKVEKRLKQKEYCQTCSQKPPKPNHAIQVAESRPHNNYTSQNKEVSLNTLTLEEDNELS